MRNLIFILAILSAVLLLSACARSWSHPDYTNDKQVKYHYEEDSTFCSIQANDKYPLDKRKQEPIFDACMERKGWVKKDTLGFERY